MIRCINLFLLTVLLSIQSISAQSSINSRFYVLYNQYRLLNHLSVLSADTNLEKAACEHSFYLALMNYSADSDSFAISHYETVKVKNVKSLYAPVDRVNDYDTSKRYHVAENITAIYNGEFTSDDILTNWINSPPHNLNLLNTKNARIGLGIIIFEKTVNLVHTQLY